MNRDDAQSATARYLRQRSFHRFVAFIILALLIVSVVLAHVPDDWAKFDHRTFHVIDAPAGDLLKISTGDEVKLLGITSDDPYWLRDRAVDSDVTLLLESPQTRDSAGHLRAFVYQGNENLSVEAAKAGAARLDRREKSLFDGAIGPAEAEARKKKTWEVKDGLAAARRAGHPALRAAAKPRL